MRSSLSDLASETSSQEAAYSDSIYGAWSLRPITREDFCGESVVELVKEPVAGGKVVHEDSLNL